MNRKKAIEEHKLPDYERIKRYYSKFLKGTLYKKSLPRNSFIKFTYGWTSAPKPYPLAFHKELELPYIRQGRGSYYIAGKLYSYQKRLLLIIKPNEIHTASGVPLKEKVEMGCLVFPLDWLGMELDVKSWPNAVLLNEAEAARMDMICGQVSEEVNQKQPGYEDMIRVKFQEVCCLVRRIVSQPKKELANPLVDQLREYIDQHFAERTSILDISQSFGYTGRHLAGVFKKSTGMSLKRFMLQRRVMEARVLLETKPELKLTAIAGQVGFEDYRLFHRIFKILTGVNPESYRSVIKKTVANKD